MNKNYINYFFLIDLDFIIDIIISLGYNINFIIFINLNFINLRKFLLQDILNFNQLMKNYYYNHFHFKFNYFHHNFNYYIKNIIIDFVIHQIIYVAIFSFYLNVFLYLRLIN